MQTDTAHSQTHHAFVDSVVVMDTVPLLPRLHDMRSPVLESITTLLGLAFAESRLSMNGLGTGEGVTGDGDGDGVVPTTFPTEKSMATTCDRCQGTHSGKLVRHTDTSQTSRTSELHHCKSARANAAVGLGAGSRLSWMRRVD